MKVLHIVQASYPSQSGYVIRTESILDSLQTPNLKMDVVGSIFSKRSEQLSKGRLFVYNDRTYYQLLNNSLLLALRFFNKLPVFRYLTRYLEMALNVFLVLIRVKVRKYDIIHGHSTYRNGLCALLIAKLYKKPFVYDVHALTIDALCRKTMGYRIGYFFENIIISKADYLIVIDNALKKHIIDKFHVAEDHLSVASNGIDCNRFAPNNSELLTKYVKERGDGKVLVGVDNSKKIEGFQLLLENISSILEMVPNVHFVVFGNKGKRHRPDVFTYLPQIPFEDMSSIYSGLDFFLMPRLLNDQTDTITPLKILEVMACEVVVIVSDVGGLTCCVSDEETGFIIESLNPGGVIKALNTALNWHKPYNIAKGGRDWVRRRKSWSKVGKIYLKCYSEVSRGKRKKWKTL